MRSTRQQRARRLRDPFNQANVRSPTRRCAGSLWRCRTSSPRLRICMSLKSVNVNFFAGSWMSLPLVQTKMASIGSRKPAAHFPGVVQARSDQAAICSTGPCYRKPQRDPLTIHMEMDISATSPSAVGSRPRPSAADLLRARRGLPQVPSIACHRASIPTFSPYSVRSMRSISAMKPVLPQRWKCSYTVLFEPYTRDVWPSGILCGICKGSRRGLRTVEAACCRHALFA